MKTKYLTLFLIASLITGISLNFSSCAEVREDLPDRVLVTVKSGDIQNGGHVNIGETRRYQYEGSEGSLDLTVTFESIDKPNNTVTVKIKCADGTTRQIVIPLNDSEIDTGCLSSTGKKIFIKIKK